MLLVLEKCLMKLVFCACSWAVAANGYMSPSCAHAGGQESSSLHKGPAYSKLSQNVLVVPVLAVIPPLCAINPSPPLTPLGSCILFPWTRQVIQRFHWEKCSPMVKLFQATNGVKHCQQRLLWYCLFTPNLFFSFSSCYFFPSLCDKVVGRQECLIADTTWMIALQCGVCSPVSLNNHKRLLDLQCSSPQSAMVSMLHGSGLWL